MCFENYLFIRDLVKDYGHCIIDFNNHLKRYLKSDCDCIRWSCQSVSVDDINYLHYSIVYSSFSDIDILINMNNQKICSFILNDRELYE